MKYELVLTGKFKRGLRLVKKRGLDISLLEDVVERLLHKIPLEAKTGIMLLVEIIKVTGNVTFSLIGYYYI